jgi:hypothetical protein
MSAVERFFRWAENPRNPITILFILVMFTMASGFFIIQRNAEERVVQICEAHDNLANALRAVVEATQPVPEQFGELTDDPDVRAAFERATRSNEFFRKRALDILEETTCPVVP